MSAGMAAAWEVAAAVLVVEELRLAAVAVAVDAEADLESRESDHSGRMDQKGRHALGSAQLGLCYLPAALAVNHLLAQARPHPAETDQADS